MYLELQKSFPRTETSTTLTVFNNHQENTNRSYVKLHNYSNDALFKVPRTMGSF